MFDAEPPCQAGEGTLLEPATQQFIDSLAAAGGQGIGPLSAADARALLAIAQVGMVGRPVARIENVELPVGPTRSVGVRIVRPGSAKAALPVVMYFHGGGWMLGDRETHDRLIREIAVGAGAAVFFVDYDRAPEARYPVAVEQAYAATKYAAEHGAQFDVDPTRLAVVGDGAGGNIAAAVALLAKERRGPKIDLQVLFYPIAGADFETGSYRTFATGPWLTRQAMEWFWDSYLPDKAARQEITATPLNAPIDRLMGLPETLIIVAENDVLRDEGECYARKLMQAGVRVTSTRYNGTIHDFVMLNALADTPAARSAIAQATSALKSVLE
ncbi:MAG: alpha/beta hydrolase [Methylobacteriaceae bacterium]|nr:alpha/beta hydrolase [Methylobacteriaceae bacterium]